MMGSAQRVVQLRRSYRPSPARFGASRFQVALGRIRVWFGQALQTKQMPGLLRDAEIQDEVTGQSIVIRTGPLFTRISVNGRDYFFDRFTGRFDGSGFGCSS